MKWILVLFLFSFKSFANPEFIYSYKVNKSKKEAIQKDMEWLKRLKFTKPQDPKTLMIFETDKMDSSFLMKWLFDRVQYIFDREEFSEFDLNRDLEVESPVFDYPYPDIFPSEILGNNYLARGRNGILMTNVGTGLYLSGKMEKVLLALEMKDDQKNKKRIILRSPRVGLIRLGDNFWMGARRRERDYIDYRILRISTLFHEARHSDGHGESLGFLHSICPEGHDFSGERACDRSTNGPYSVDAYLAYELSWNCKECDEEVKEVLKLKILDSLSRVIVDGDFEDHLLPTEPEGER